MKSRNLTDSINNAVDGLIYAVKTEKNLKESILGAIALHDVPMKNGDKKNVWIEYNANILAVGLVDAGVHECIIYDEIPDIVLDKYNNMTKIKFNEQINNH